MLHTWMRMQQRQISNAKRSLSVLVPAPELVRRLSTQQRLLAPSNSERDHCLSEWLLHLLVSKQSKTLARLGASVDD